MRAAIACLAMLSLVNFAFAQECFDWGTLSDPLLGSYPREGTIIALDAAGDFLCAAVRTPTVDRLEWYSVADGPEPVRLAIVDFPDSGLRSLRVDGTRAAVARTDGGWSVVDFQDPALPWLAGARAGGLDCREIDLQGDWVYSAENSGGLAVYELIGGGVPPERARLVPGNVVHVDADGDRCWVTGGRPWVEGDPEEDYLGFSILVALDIADPTAPVEVGRHELGHGYSYSSSFGVLRADGGRVMVQLDSSFTEDIWPNETTYYYSAYFFDAAALPAFPSTGGFQHSNPANGLAIVGDAAYLLADGKVTYFRRDGAAWTVSGHTVRDGARLAATAAGVWVRAASDIHALTPTLAEGSPWLGIAGRRVADSYFDLDAVPGGLVVRAFYDCDGGLCPPAYEDIIVLDATDPMDLVYTQALGSTYGTLYGTLGSYAIADDLVYSAAGIWNWTDGSHVGDLPISAGFGTGVLAVIGTAAWTRVGSDIQIYDVADPGAPVAVGTFFAGERIDRVVRDGGLAVCSTDESATRFLVVDVTDPLAPVELNREALASYPVRDMDLQGDRLLVADADGIGSYLVGPDGTLARAGGLAPGDVVRIVRRGSILYATVDLEGVLAIDVSDPTSPAEIGRVEIDVSPGDAAVVGDVLYVYDGAIQALQLHCDGSVPVLLRDLALDVRDGACRLTWRLDGDVVGQVRVLAAAGGRSWVVPWRYADGGSVAVDAAARPGESVTYAVQMLAGGTWTTVAEKSIVVPVPALDLRAPVPNPFNPETALGFSLDRGGPVELAVFDVAGRRVRTLVSDRLEAGPHAVTWRGVDDAGREVPAGTYIARLRADGGVRSVKLLLLK